MSREKIIEFNRLAEQLHRMALDILFERKSAAGNKPASWTDMALDQAVLTLIGVTKVIACLLQEE